MHEEFCRGHAIVDKLYKDHQRGNVLDEEMVASGEIWRDLFEPSDFFIGYPHYLSLCVVGPTQQDAQAWAGFVESRLKRLVSDMLGRSLPMSKIQLWPKKFDACVADRGALLTHAQRTNSITYFIGFRADTLRMRGNQLDVERQLVNFRNQDLTRFHPLVPGMDILPRSFRVKELPKICFEGIYEGGKVAAMKRRRVLIEADPKFQEAKNKKKLAKLKKRMEAMQRQKQEADSANAMSSEGELVAATTKEEVETDAEDDAEWRKRKRGEDCVEPEGGDHAVKSENEEEEEEEAARLESALDAIAGAGLARHKSREEADIDRKKLLAGELLGDAAEDANQAARDEKLAGQPTSEEREAEELRRAGLVVISDDEATMLGGNRILPWRHGYQRATAGFKKERLLDNKQGEQAAPDKSVQRMQVRTAIRFKTQFDIVKLDTSGRAVDKGDDDFTPSLQWTGRKGGFEFKLGERGLGYYRTGKKVVVPSNVAYS